MEFMVIWIWIILQESGTDRDTSLEAPRGEDAAEGGSPTPEKGATVRSEVEVQLACFPGEKRQQKLRRVDPKGSASKKGIE